MPAVTFSPIGNGVSFLNTFLSLLNGGFINTYQAGTSTPLATYTTNIGDVANTNPIVLNADGRPPQEIWLVRGSSYKLVISDALSNVIVIYDNIIGIDGVLRADLASASDITLGDALIGMKRTLTAAIATTLHRWYEATAVNLVSDFGVVLDGATDNTTALQSAFSSGASHFYLPAGQCNLSGTINITTPIVIFGVGRGPISIFAGTSSTQSMFNITTIGGVTFRDLCISSTVTKTAGIGIAFNPAGATENDRSVLERVYFSGQFTAVDFVKAAYWIMRDCDFVTNPTNALLVRIRNTTTPDAGDSTMEDCRFFGGVTATHVSYEGSGGLRVINNKFLQGAFGLNATFAGTVVTGILTVIGNSFDGQTDTGFVLKNTSATSSFTNVVVSANIFDGSPTTAFISCSATAGVGGVGRINISGNTFLQNTGAAPLINLISGGNYNVSANAINGVATNNAVAIAAAVTDSVVGPNMLESLVYSNASTTTLVINSISGGTPQLVISSAANPNATVLGQAPIAPTLLNSWVNFAAGTTAAGYYKDSFGNVFLRGRVKSGTINSIIFSLPAGYRPAAQSKFPIVENNVPAVVFITSGGDVTQQSGGNTELSLDGIVFQTQ